MGKGRTRAYFEGLLKSQKNKKGSDTVSKDFTVIYKILRTLQKWRGRESFEVELISAKAMKMEYEDWEQLMIELQEDGYIKGLVYSQGLTDMFPHISEPICPEITIKGLEYLEENKFMRKAANMLKGAVDIVK